MAPSPIVTSNLVLVPSSIMKRQHSVSTFGNVQSSPRRITPPAPFFGNAKALLPLPEPLPTSYKPMPSINAIIVT
jgi:hypothetical protein